MMQLLSFRGDEGADLFFSQHGIVRLEWMMQEQKKECICVSVSLCVRETERAHEKVQANEMQLLLSVCIISADSQYGSLNGRNALEWKHTQEYKLS